MYRLPSSFTSSFLPSCCRAVGLVGTHVTHTLYSTQPVIRAAMRTVSALTRNAPPPQPCSSACSPETAACIGSPIVCARHFSCCVLRALIKILGKTHRRHARLQLQLVQLDLLPYLPSLTIHRLPFDLPGTVQALGPGLSMCIAQVEMDAPVGGPVTVTYFNSKETTTGESGPWSKAGTVHSMRIVRESASGHPSPTRLDTVTRRPAMHDPNRMVDRFTAPSTSDRQSHRISQAKTRQTPVFRTQNSSYTHLDIKMQTQMRASLRHPPLRFVNAGTRDEASWKFQREKKRSRPSASGTDREPS